MAERGIRTLGRSFSPYNGSSAVLWGVAGGVSHSWHIDTRLFSERAPRIGFQSLVPVHSIMEQTYTNKPLRKKQCSARKTDARRG